MDYLSIIDKYYPDNDKLKKLLLKHSRCVADKALEIADRHPEYHADRTFLEEAAMLHDIGVCRTDAPGIECFGTEPYIRHGIIGAEMMRNEGFPRHARVCERHTGTGITRRAIEERNLPLPPADYLPETIEEQMVCYADKFFSKSHPERVRTVEQTAQSLAKFGDDCVKKFMQWADMFE
ncbi:MAG: HDIG domain-containing metalloprotein [Prevotella sp.]